MSETSIQAVSEPSWQTRYPGFVRATWLLLLAFALHELEEWNILAYYQTHFPDGPPMSVTNVRVTLVAMVLIYWLGVYAAMRTRSARRAGFIILLLAATLFLNALEHIYFAARWREYGPGLVTAVTLLLPASSLVAWRAWRDGLVPRSFIVALAMFVVLTSGVWAIHPEANVTRKHLAADRIGGALVRLLVP